MGWHIPTSEEWTILITYLGGESLAGSKLKEIGNAHWTAPTTPLNPAANNSSGFTALPGGYRSYDGEFGSINRVGYWWSSTPQYYDLVWGRSISFWSNKVWRYYYINRSGFSIRCIRD